MSTLNELWSAAIVDECVRAGARHAVVCPGSRSTPLALACLADERLKTRVVVDERSAAFVALGIGLESGAPAILVCTSGTAGAHFLPAVIEASLSRVPMIVLTADRPPELHGFGAPQTIEQVGLYGRYARDSVDLGVPEASSDVFQHLRAQVAKVAGGSQRVPRGPVHLNCPFREPLAPSRDPAHQVDASIAAGRAEAPFLDVCANANAPSASAIEKVRRLLQQRPRAIIVCGPRAREDGFGSAVRALGASYGLPVLAEAASQARFSGATDVIAHYDAILCDPATAQALKPELVLRFGGGLTSKRLQQWLDASGAEQVLFSDDGDVFDPQHRARCVVVGSANEVCRQLSSGVLPTSSPYAAAFRAAEAKARGALEAAFAADARLTEPRIAREVVAALPSGAQLFVASSMPVRDVDAFASGAEAIRVFSNRGANGIDGILSSALGVSASSGRPTVALVGDLACLHDVGALVTAKRAGLSLAIVAVNNDGGGIFSFLPIAQHAAPFETLFGTPHGLTFEAAAQWVGARYVRPETPAELFAAVRGAGEPGLSLIEVRVPTTRTGNVEAHRALQGRVVAALVEGGR